MSVKIITDSTADMPAWLREKVTVVPMNLHFGEKAYRDGVDISSDEFYEMLESSKDLPSTSQPTPLAFEEIYEEALREADQVLCVTVSSALSGTFQSANIAAAAFPGKVFLLDSRHVTISLTALVAYAVSLQEQGLDAQAILEHLQQALPKLRLYAVVDTLEYLKRGGRISATAAFAGGVLNLKPVITLVDGALQVVAKARGPKQAMSTMSKFIAEKGMDETKPVFFGWSGIPSEKLEEYLGTGEPLPANAQALPRVRIGSVVGTHAGPGAFAVAYFEK